MMKDKAFMLSFNTKICFPHDTCGTFASLKEAWSELNRIGAWKAQTLVDIIQYNICYRDYWREYGLDNLLKAISEELDIPGLVDDPILKVILRMRLDRGVAGHDIQCFHISDDVKILGRTFKGLDDISRHVSIYSSLSGERESDSFLLPRCYDVDGERYADVYIGSLSKYYFDKDNRSQSYQNFIFRPQPITQEDMKRSFSMIDMNLSYFFCGVNEFCLGRPMLYHNTSSDFMLLATDKSDR